MSIEISGVPARSARLLLLPDDGPLQAEVVAVRDGKSVCVALGETTGLRAGTPATPVGRPLSILVGDGLLGRVLDGLGRPMDGGPPSRTRGQRGGAATASAAEEAGRRATSAGGRVLDGLIPCGKGQRLGISQGRESGNRRSCR